MTDGEDVPTTTCHVELAANGFGVVRHEKHRRNKKAATATWLMTEQGDGGRRLVIGILWRDERDRILRAITGWSE
jgi:hypothetical protein